LTDFSALSIDGTIATHDDANWDEARAAWNLDADQRPAAVAIVENADDVATVARFAAENNLNIAGQGTGHGAAPLAPALDGAILVKTQRMHGIEVDPDAQTAKVEAGALSSDLGKAANEHGLVFMPGSSPNVGVTGFTLGGGLSWFGRRHGFACNRVTAIDLVTADGEAKTVDADHDPDLFWALRGGGGNFGIVTSFTFRCHDIGEHGTIIGGPVFYDLADTAEVMRWYRELIPSLPEELSGWIALLTVPPVPPFPEALWGRKVCGIVWCYTGAHDKADEVLAPVKTHGSPLMVGLQPMPFTALQGAFDPLYPAGLQWYWRADFFNEISDTAIEVHRKYGAMLPTGHSTMHMYPIDGAASRVPENATAFAYRDGGWAGVIVGVDPDPANAGLISQWTRDYWEELHPTSAGGAYVNFLMNEGQDRVKASYRGNYARLTQVKERYDPGNTFHINQNIQPASEPGL
jgi:hypothetical protein